jgi:hypothetical protein
MVRAESRSGRAEKTAGREQTRRLLAIGRESGLVQFDQELPG